MQNNQRHLHALQARRSKVRIAYQATLSLISRMDRRQCLDNVANWYQIRKRASQRIRNVSEGQVILLDNGYRGDHRRHWVKDCRCEHVYRISLKELIQLQGQGTCPFCNIPSDLSRCGSIQAVQEHVYRLSHGNIFFLGNNPLGSVDDTYQFQCLIHSLYFLQPFRRFMEAPEHGCDSCAVEREYHQR